jgi:hypothetical protein
MARRKTDYNDLETDIIKDVDDFLKDTGDLPLKTGVRLTLTLMKNLTQDFQSLRDELGETARKVAQNERDITELKEKNLINLASHNPKTAVAVFVIFIIAVDLIVDKFSSSDLWLVFITSLKKLLGL